MCVFPSLGSDSAAVTTTTTGSTSSGKKKEEFAITDSVASFSLALILSLSLLCWHVSQTSQKKSQMTVSAGNENIDFANVLIVFWLAPYTNAFKGCQPRVVNTCLEAILNSEL